MQENWSSKLSTRWVSWKLLFGDNRFTTRVLKWIRFHPGREVCEQCFIFFGEISLCHVTPAVEFILKYVYMSALEWGTATINENIVCKFSILFYYKSWMYRSLVVVVELISTYSPCRFFIIAFVVYFFFIFLIPENEAPSHKPSKLIWNSNPLSVL